MTYQEFLNCIPAYVGIYKENIIVLKGNFYPSVPKYPRWYREEKKIDKKLYKEALYFSCDIGGYQGGNCWDDSEPRYYRNGNEISYDELDSLLEKLYPDLSFLQYRKITKLLSEKQIWSENEYYGNTIDYEYQTLPLKELYDLLIEMRYLK
jgi:hypothetical protein